MDRPLVARATSSDDSPTPGYLYGEIAQMTHANFEGCRQLTAYLLERIKKPNHNIKFKCLHIIKVWCRAQHGYSAGVFGRERLLCEAGLFVVSGTEMFMRSDMGERKHHVCITISVMCGRPA